MSLLAQDGRLARRVGAITLLVMAAASAGFVFLFDRAAFGAPIRFRVMFRHSAGLHEHAPLIVAGQPIGRIAAISPVLHGDRGPLAGEVGVAATVEVKADDAWRVPASATIFVASRGPLSDRYLEVAPPTGDPGPAIRDGAELRGIDPPTLDNVLQHTWTNLTTFRLFVDAVRPELTALRAQLEQLRGAWGAIAGDARTAGGSSSSSSPGSHGSPGSIDALADATRSLIAAAQQTRDTALGGDPGVAQLLATLREARQAIADIRAAIDVLGPEVAAATAQLTRIRGHVAASDPLRRADQALATVRSALDKIDPLLAAASELGDRFARGEGSIGRLLHDPEFPEDTKELGKIMKRQPWKILQRPHD